VEVLSSSQNAIPDKSRELKIFINFQKKDVMKKSHFTESQKLAILAKQDSGQNVESICRAHQISPATFYKWKRDISMEKDEDKRRLKHLEQENKRLKRMYAELKIDHDILQEGYDMAKKILARQDKKK